MNGRQFAGFWAMTCVGVAMIAGCSSSNSTGSTKAVGSLVNTRDELADSRKQVAETQSALDALQVPDTDLKMAFATFRREVKESEASATKVRNRAIDMNKRAAEYQKTWQQETAELNNPDLRASAQARAAKVRARYDVLVAKAADARGAYEPWITGLKDIEKYLRNDLTAAGIRNAEPGFRKSKVEGQKLAQKMDALATELDNVAASISPTPVPPAEAK